MLLSIQLCTHLFLTKNVLPSVPHGFYPIYKNKETHQSRLHYLETFWHGFQVLAQIKFVEFSEG